jgi:thiol-disulfide isomerase/thioredoxin
MIICLILSGGCSDEIPSPYDRDADPQHDLETALLEARAGDKHVLIVFGAHWCPDCRALFHEMQTDPLASFVTANFVVMHVHIGNWNHNMHFVQRFGTPVAQGIPSIAIVGGEGRTRFVSNAGELASARSRTNAELREWFETLVEEPVH